MNVSGPFRSWLFAPGNHRRRVEKALSLDADVVILDLEDAVAVAEKPATRELVVAALLGPRTGLGYIRVNAYDTDFCYGDLCAVVAKGVVGGRAERCEHRRARVSEARTAKRRNPITQKIPRSVTSAECLSR